MLGEVDELEGVNSWDVDSEPSSTKVIPQNLHMELKYLSSIS